MLVLQIYRVVVCKSRSTKIPALSMKHAVDFHLPMTVPTVITTTWSNNPLISRVQHKAGKSCSSAHRDYKPHTYQQQILLALLCHAICDLKSARAFLQGKKETTPKPTTFTKSDQYKSVPLKKKEVFLSLLNIQMSTLQMEKKIQLFS